MTKSKRKGKNRRKNWHHRVPDFKLVDCTPKPLQYKKSKKKIEIAIKNKKQIATQ